MKSNLARLKPALWILSLSAALISLLRMEGFVQPDQRYALPLGDQPWLSKIDPMAITAELAWVLSILLLTYLLLVTSIYGLLALLPQRHRSELLRRATKRLTPKLLTTVLASILMSAGPASAATMGGSGSAGGAASPSSGERPTIERIGPSSDVKTSLPWAPAIGKPNAPSEDPSVSSVAEVSPTVGERKHEAGSETTPPDLSSDGVAGVAAALENNSGPDLTSSGAGEAAPISRSEHVVVAGEHFWSIAEAVASERMDREAGDADVAQLWVRLVDANRHKLVDPGNPDLILPGQVLTLPD